MKNYIIILFFLGTGTLFSQKINSKSQINKVEIQLPTSETRTFLDNANKTRINKDWSLSAEFKSGIGETVTFFPVQIIDLDSKKEINAIQLDMMVKQTAGILGAIGVQQTYAWIDYDEIDSFISFIEMNIIPNLDLKFKDKSSEFIFNAKEITLIFLIHEKKRKLTIQLNSSNMLPFWTETQVENFPKLLPMLKKVKNKELIFE